MREKWYFTFGMGHFNANKYVVLLGDVETTRQRMHELFGNGWSMQYNEEQFEKIQKKWNYKILFAEV